MTVAEPAQSPLPYHLLALVTALVHSSTPAFYTVSWKPWLRYMLASCIVVVLIIVVRVAGIWIGTTM